MKIALLFAASAVAMGACGSAAAPVAPVAPTIQATAPKVELPTLANAEDFDYAAEFTGAVRIGGSIDEVIAEYGNASDVGEVEVMEATGEWGQRYLWPSVGLEIWNAAETAEGPFLISSVAFSDLSNIRTIRDIGIGSTRAEVEAAYRPAINLGESEDSTIVVGQNYGGIMFELDDGGSRVVSFFVGTPE